jgi:hypothetical protein
MKHECVVAYYKRINKIKSKQDIALLRKKIKSIKDYRKDLRQVLHKYVRLRDKDSGCISCGKPLIGKYDAGHYLSCGAYPNLAFHELNIHGQCTRCNQHLHGNLIEYTERLPLRIGKEAYDDLMSLRNVRTHLNIDEIKSLIAKYKLEIKKLDG